MPLPPGQFPQYQAVGKVRVDPRNSNNVVAGTKTGLYFSYDGGTNWTGPCTTNSFNTMRQDITGLALINNGSSTRIIAAVGVRGFATTVQANLNQNGANGIYAGTLPASGCPADFTSIATNANGWTGLNAASGTAYVNSTTGNQLGRVEFAVAPSNSNYMYAQVQSITPNPNSGCGGANGCQLGAYRTTDGGLSWTQIPGSTGASLINCSGGAGDYPQNWYDQALAVDPNNPDRVFFSTFDVWFWQNGNSAWNDTSCGYSGGNIVHVDQHALAFRARLFQHSARGQRRRRSRDHQRAICQSGGRPDLVQHGHGPEHDRILLRRYQRQLRHLGCTAGERRLPGQRLHVRHFFRQPDRPGAMADGQRRRWLLMPASIRSAREQACGSGKATTAVISTVAPTTAPPPARAGAIGPAAGLGDTQSFILPYEIFKGDPNTPGNDCGPAGATTGCGHLVAGTVRVWETITGAAANPTWYVNSPPNLTKQTLGNRSFINQLAFAQALQSTVIVGTNDGNVQIGRGLGTGSNQSTWVNVTGGNTVLPNRPILDVVFDPTTTTAPIGLRRGGRLQRQHAHDPRPCLPGSLHDRLRLVHLER